jgi:hypothetical protein
MEIIPFLSTEIAPLHCSHSTLLSLIMRFSIKVVFFRVVAIVVVVLSFYNMNILVSSSL